MWSEQFFISTALVCLIQANLRFSCALATQNAEHGTPLSWGHRPEGNTTVSPLNQTQEKSASAPTGMKEQNVTIQLRPFEVMLEPVDSTLTEDALTTFVGLVDRETLSNLKAATSEITSIHFQTFVSSRIEEIEKDPAEVTDKEVLQRLFGAYTEEHRLFLRMNKTAIASVVVGTDQTLSVAEDNLNTVFPTLIESLHGAVEAVLRDVNQTATIITTMKNQFPQELQDLQSIQFVGFSNVSSASLGETSGNTAQPLTGLNVSTKRPSIWISIIPIVWGICICLLTGFCLCNLPKLSSKGHTIDSIEVVPGPAEVDRAVRKYKEALKRYESALLVHDLLSENSLYAGQMAESTRRVMNHYDTAVHLYNRAVHISELYRRAAMDATTHSTQSSFSSAGLGHHPRSLKASRTLSSVQGVVTNDTIPEEQKNKIEKGRENGEFFGRSSSDSVIHNADQRSQQPGKLIRNPNSIHTLGNTGTHVETCGQNEALVDPADQHQKHSLELTEEFRYNFDKKDIPQKNATQAMSLENAVHPAPGSSASQAVNERNEKTTKELLGQVVNSLFLPRHSRVRSIDANEVGHGNEDMELFHDCITPSRSNTFETTTSSSSSPTMTEKDKQIFLQTVKGILNGSKPGRPDKQEGTLVSSKVGGRELYEV